MCSRFSPSFFAGPFEHGVVARAQKAGLLGDPHPQSAGLDRRPAQDGGRPAVRRRRGNAAEAGADVSGGGVDLAASATPDRKVVLLSAQGGCSIRRWPSDWQRDSELLLICGRYEGVDERVAEHLADEEISIGDYVLSGGELAAAVVVDAVARLLPGVLGNEASAVCESFRTQAMDRMLDCPQYTRPAEFRGWRVPEVLLGGNHEEIRRWRQTGGAGEDAPGCGRTLLGRQECEKQAT